MRIVHQVITHNICTGIVEYSKPALSKQIPQCVISEKHEVDVCFGMVCVTTLPNHCP